MMRWLFLVCLLFLPAQAQAGLSQAAIDTVSADPPPHAQLDLSLAATDERDATRTLASVFDGKPAFVVFVDYTCRSVCGSELFLLSEAIAHSQLVPGTFHIVVLGIDPKDGADAAHAMKAKMIPPALQQAAYFLRPGEDAVKKTTAELGYRYVYDSENDQFAHATAVYFLDGSGRLQAVLSPFALTTQDLTRLFTGGEPSGLVQAIHLLCYAYDPKTGTYAARIDLIAKGAAFLFLLLFSGVLFWLFRRGRRA
jgi:protein SCO1/2